MQFKVYNVFSTEGFAAKYRKSHKLLTKPPSKLAVITFLPKDLSMRLSICYSSLNFDSNGIKFANVAFNSWLTIIFI